MGHSEDIPVVFENGVFRPVTPVDIPEHSRLRISIRDESSVGGQVNGQSLRDALEGLRARGLIRTGGWRPTRDELHERG